MKNPFPPNVRAGLLHRMEQDGCETFSDKIRWVEEHMPNIDDPASFVAVLVRGKARNPPDRDYSALLGEGAFSKAYGKLDNMGLFYESNRGLLDRGERAVETVTQRMWDRYPGLSVDPDDIDVSKVLIIDARELLKGDKQAQAYLPTIEPVRIDYTDPDVPELIFSMPVYKTVQELRVKRRVSAATDALTQALHLLTRDNPVDEELPKLRDDYLQKQGIFLPPEAAAQRAPIIRAIEALDAAAEKLPFAYNSGEDEVTGKVIRHIGLDLHQGNLAVDAKGHFILLDPIVAVAKLEDVERYWQAKGWPGGPSTPAKRRR